jgi:hypothetical protein
VRVAGLSGFIVGQAINKWVVVAIKAHTKERHLWAPVVVSTFAGRLGDTRLRDVHGTGLDVQNLGRGGDAADHLPAHRVDQETGADIPAHADTMSLR